jgi:hypothetical protein
VVSIETAVSLDVMRGLVRGSCHFSLADARYLFFTPSAKFEVLYCPSICKEGMRKTESTLHYGGPGLESRITRTQSTTLL